MQERFDQLDTNKDGVLTMEEIGRPRLFQRLDADGDGVVTRSEAVAFFETPISAFAASERNSETGRRRRRKMTPA